MTWKNINTLGKSQNTKNLSYGEDIFNVDI